MIPGDGDINHPTGVSAGSSIRARTGAPRCRACPRTPVPSTYRACSRWRSTNTVSSPKELAASRLAAAIASSRSSGPVHPPHHPYRHRRRGFDQQGTCQSRWSGCTHRLYPQFLGLDLQRHRSNARRQSADPDRSGVAGRPGRSPGSRQSVAGVDGLGPDAFGRAQDLRGIRYESRWRPLSALRVCSAPRSAGVNAATLW